jgi:hypothetical protein
MTTRETIMHNWTTIPLIDSDGDAIPGGHDSTRERALAEYISTGSMTTVFFAQPEPGQEDLEQRQWGPTVDGIDWSHWPTCDWCSSPAAWREAWQTDLTPGSAFLYACADHRTENMHPFGST